MIYKHSFHSQKQAESLLKDKIIAVVTEYTIFKLDLADDRVEFRCLQNEYSFDVLFQALQEEIKARKEDLEQAFLETIITYCAVVHSERETNPYPICEFEDMDALLDWYQDWMLCSIQERLAYLEGL